MFPKRVGNWQFGPAWGRGLYYGSHPQAELRSAWGYSDWAALRPCSLARQDFYSTPYIATDRAPAGPNLNNPELRKSPQRGEWGNVPT